ncbi:MAG: hypothetical protein KKD35_05865 [Elusimicrobia bacterium]|nr:hypothetical protein [Elusimicrobiota bacterium]
MNILLFPPIAFILVFIFVYLLFRLITPVKVINLSSKVIQDTDKSISPDEKIACNYQRFFPLAAFFIFLHIAGLIVSAWAFNPLIETIGPVIAYLTAITIILAVLFI